MKTIMASPFLKSVLLLDAAVGMSVVLLQLTVPGWLAALLDLQPAVLVETGMFLIGYVALLLVLALSARIWAALVWLIVLGNVGWAIGCVLLLATDAVAPNALGVAFVLMHAVTVLLLAGFEIVGLKGSAAVTDTHALQS